MINIHKSVAFLYSNKDLSERENNKTALFKITSKRIRHWGINLIREVKDLYCENYKTMKEIEGDTNKWKDIPCTWIGTINIA